MTTKIVRTKKVARPEGVDEDGVIHEAYDMTSHRTVGAAPKRTPKAITKDRQSATGKLRAVHVGDGLPDLPTMAVELQTMTDVLLGRTPPPIDAGHLTLLEVADAYFARASELTMLIQEGEREGTVMRGSSAYRFRTGELRTFMEMAKRAADLGSRRITAEQLQFEMAVYGRESLGSVR